MGLLWDCQMTAFEMSLSSKSKADFESSGIHSRMLRGLPGNYRSFRIFPWPKDLFYPASMGLPSRENTPKWLWFTTKHGSFEQPRSRFAHTSCRFRSNVSTWLDATFLKVPCSRFSRACRRRLWYFRMRQGRRISGRGNLGMGQMDPNGVINN